jgi:predicted O-methyltransferase YrrM
VEIDPDRHRIAVANFAASGLAPYIDARLGDAHALVPALPGPFDFVFSDADCMQGPARRDHDHRHVEPRRPVDQLQALSGPPAVQRVNAG